MSERRTRVPEVTALFWAIKILTTGVGEVASDFLVKTFDPVPVVLLAFVAFLGAGALQLTARRYVPWRYWSFVLLVAVFGTMVADVAHIVVGVPYLLSAFAFAVVLALVFLLWRRTEGTLSVHSIRTNRRELFYWATVLATFALGTATGDLTATTLGLGYLGSALLFAALFAIPAMGLRLGLPATGAFWTAYVLTRPLGASIADWLAVTPDRGGLDLGHLLITAVGLGLIAVGVAIMQFRAQRHPELS
ncbi:MAG TPA: hypothetical protein VGM70_05695 [Pseudolysinimonas sp.]|jgi:uncharacterized membrane-anchored protein